MRNDLLNNHLVKAGIEILRKGSDSRYQQFLPPNGGEYPISHQDTFQTVYSTLSKVYRDSDEALLNSRENARYMLNDLGIRECLDCRQRSVCLLDWSLEAEDDKSESQKEFCSMLEDMIRRIRNFYEFRLSLQDAIWYGKSANKLRWRCDKLKGHSFWRPMGLHADDKGWQQIHGDKLVFRMDRPKNVPGAYEGQMGIRVGQYNYREGDIINGRWRVEMTDFGMAYFLNPEERSNLVCVHKHHCKDAAFEDGQKAGSIHGVGIRSTIYWEWIQKQETQAFLVEFMERMAGGIQMWKYPQGNEQARQEVRAAAMNYNSGKEHVMIVPVPVGETGQQYGVDVVEPGFGSIETLQHLIKDYFNNRVKRYVIGQTLTSEAEATGMGSGVADLHLDTYLQIIKADSLSHDESVTAELIEPFIRINVMKGVFNNPGFTPRFKTKTEDDNIKERVEVMQGFMDRKVKFRMKDIYNVSGFAQPGPGDEVNEDADPPQAGLMGDGLPGQAAGDTPPPGGDVPKLADKKKADPESKESNTRIADEDPDKNSSGISENHVQRYGVNGHAGHN